MAKDKKTIKYEADISGFKKNIETANNNIKTLNNTLKLNQAQLKGNKESVQLLSEKVGLLKEKYDEQGKVVENTRVQYEKAVEVYGENSKQAENLKNKLIQAETKQQSIANAIKETNEQLAVQSSKLISAGSSMTEFGDRTSKVGDKIDKVGNKLSVLSAGVTAVAVASLKASISFESAWTGVTKTVDGTEEQLNDLRQGILDLSTQIPSTAEEIAGVAENAGQLGIATDNVLSFTKVMIDLGNSTNLSADEASSALAKFANVTKMSASDYDKLGSTIVALGNNFATTEADIVEMATRLASTGELAGLSQSQILALATSMSSVGIEAEAGGSAMSKLLKQIQVAVETGSSDLKDFAKVAGVSTEEFKKAFEKDAVGALSSFISGLNDTERNGKSAISILDDMGITEVRLSNTILSLANASDVMTSAVELSEKAWKENTALTDEANKRYETTESKLQMLKNEIVKNGIALGDELKPALVDVLEEVKSIITDVTSLVKKFNKLDDATKKQIINAGKMVAVLGPAVKIGGKLISTLGNGIKTVGSFSQAIGLVGKTSTEAFKNTSSGTQTLAKALTFIKSPAGIATVAITSLAGALVYFSIKQTDAQKEAKELAKEIANSKQTFEEYNQNIDKIIKANISQIDSVSQLKDELATLVDENGKVKEGYEGRVAYILNELNNALGTEYELNGDVVKSYKEIQSEIDKTIEKKKAEVILQGEQDKWAKAREEESEAIEQLYDATEQLNEAKEKYGTTLEGLRKIAEGSYGKEKKYLEDVINAYEQSVEKVKEGDEAKKQYETDYALFTEGKYDEIGKTIVNTTSNWTKGSLETLQEGIKNQSSELENWKSAYETTGNETTKIQKEQAEQNLRDLAQNLADRTSTVKTLGADEYYVWKTLAEENYRVYSEQLGKMTPEMRTRIEELTGYLQGDTSIPEGMEMLVRKTTSKFEEKMEVLTTDTQSSLKDIETQIRENTGIIYSAEELVKETGKAIEEDTSVKNAAKLLAENASNEFNNNADGTKWGTDLSKNISGGMISKNSKSSITNAAATVAGWISDFLHHTTPEKGPLKDDDKWMADFIDNMANGILNNKNKVINPVKSLSQEMKEQMNFNNVPILQGYESLRSGINNQLVDKTSTIFTTPQIVFNVQELDEAKLQQCFNYINNKFGSNY